MRFSISAFAMAAVLFHSLAGFAAPAYADTGIPRYKQFPATRYDGPRAESLNLDGVPAVAPIDALADALRSEPPNFAGRYVFMPMPAGTGCDDGVVLDLATGQVQMLPMASCGWAENGYAAPFEFNAESRLFVVAGRRGEVGDVGAHFYAFNGKSFNYIVTKFKTGELLEIIEDGPGPEVASQVEPAAGSTPLPNSTTAQPFKLRLSTKEKQQLFDMMRDKLIDAAGGSKAFVDPPFAPRFMDTGFVRVLSPDWSAFVNPTFGVVVFLREGKALKGRQAYSAVGAVELAKYYGLGTKLSDNIIIRYGQMNEALNIAAEAENLSHRSIEGLASHLVGKRDTFNNQLLLSGPIMRSLEPDIIACASSFDEQDGSKRAAREVAKLNPRGADLTFFTVDVMPLPNDEAMLVMADTQTRTLYSLFPARREGSGCSFQNPFIMINSI